MHGSNEPPPRPAVPPALLSVEQCAEILLCPVGTVESLIREGRLPRVMLTAREVGGQRGVKKWRVRPETLAAFIRSLEAYEPQPLETPAEQPAARLPYATGTDGKSRIKYPKARPRGSSPRWRPAQTA